MHGHSEKLEKFTASKSYPCILVGKLKAMVDLGWQRGHLVRNGNLCWDIQGLKEIKFITELHSSISAFQGKGF